MSDLAKKKDTELREMISQKKRELQELGFSHAKSQPGSVSAHTLRKEIARLCTELNARTSTTE